MTDPIWLEDLVSYPGVRIPNDETAKLIVELTNGLVGEVHVGDRYIRDLTPMPTRVKAIALEVAARVLRNPENAESVTTGIDDWKKTIRHRLPEMADDAGVYLTDSEERVLRGLLDAKKAGRRVGSIRLAVPGYAE